MIDTYHQTRWKCWLNLWPPLQSTLNYIKTINDRSWSGLLLPVKRAEVTSTSNAVVFTSSSTVHSYVRLSNAVVTSLSCHSFDSYPFKTKNILIIFLCRLSWSLYSMDGKLRATMTTCFPYLLTWWAGLWAYQRSSSSRWALGGHGIMDM